MAHHLQSEQRLARKLAVIIGVLLVLVLALVVAPLMLIPELRLSLAHRFDLVPGRDAEQLFDNDDDVELVVLIEEIPVALSLPTKRFTAVYAAETTDESVVLHDLNHDLREITLPLTGYTRIAGASDRSAVLFVDEERQPLQAALVIIATGEIRVLPPGELDPGIPGDWQGEIPFGVVGCGGVSPNGDWVACVRGPTGPFLAGSWELVIHRSGDPDNTIRLYRGMGTFPLAGWSGDQRWIYVQNEYGLWRIRAPI